MTHPIDFQVPTILSVSWPHPLVSITVATAPIWIVIISHLNYWQFPPDQFLPIQPSPSRQTELLTHKRRSTGPSPTISRISRHFPMMPKLFETAGKALNGWRTRPSQLQTILPAAPFPKTHVFLFLHLVSSCHPLRFSWKLSLITILKAQSLSSVLQLCPVHMPIAVLCPSLDHMILQGRR